MPAFDFDSIQKTDVEWPKRGRKPKPLPPKLVESLHESLASGTVPCLIMKNSDVTAFGNLLSTAGKKLNMRIERHILADTPEPGLTTFHFRARSKPNNKIG